MLMSPVTIELKIFKATFPLIPNFFAASNDDAIKRANFSPALSNSG